MSTGGYKLHKFSWVGGRTDSELDRTNYVLTGIVDMILNSNSGWSLDSDWNMTSSSDYKVMTIMSGTSGVNIIKFLKNQNGFKLAIGYASRSGGVSLTQSSVVNRGSTTGHEYGNVNGLYYSIIDKNIDNVDWQENDTYGISLPSSALRWIVFGNDKYYSGGIGYINTGSSVYMNTSNNVYSYYFISDSIGDKFAIFFRSSAWTTGLLKGNISGRLVKIFAHNLDLNNLYSFSVHGFTQSNGSTVDCNEAYSPTTVTTLDSFTFGGINQETNYFKTNDGRKSSSQLFDKDNHCYVNYQSYTNATTSVYMSICNTMQLNTQVCLTSITGGSRWCPIQIMLLSSNPAERGIIPGDGFKGYLDTDFIRGVTIGVYSRGQTFGVDSEFIYLGGGLAIGWDKTNTESLF